MLGGNNSSMESTGDLLKNDRPLPPPGRLVFQDAYVWLILIASLDIMCTWIVLWNHGVEVNPLAKRVLSYGAKGLVTYKFLLMIFVIALCEVVGRRNRRAAKILIGSAIALSTVPVVLAIVQLAARKYGLLP